MTLSNEISQLYSEQQQRQDVLRARAILQNTRETIIHADAEIAAIVAAGQFNTIPPALKTTLQAAWQAIKTCKAAMAAADVTETLDWKVG